MSDSDQKTLFRMDKTALSVASLFDVSDEKEYWLSRTPEERLRAVEFLRRIAYGHDRTSGRLQRVLEVVELKDLADLEQLPE